ncbi:PDT-domain-containing protein [Rhizodiscina lignyota]|uniref:prephenate dehydratase n=1 Tax=Rhizodiscina lignyota TaxID=1504668 RepID=A0A9P4M5B9_9PEZI|nr:PDT-domain-containing protein [Rhizodiscina lignyota]
MERPKVAFLGPVASYTHQAALESFPAATHELVPYTTIADIFQAAQSGAVWRGVVPFENSTNGSVVMTLDLLADRKKELKDVLVCGEAYVDVRHCLVGRLPKELRPSPDQPSRPGDDLERFKKIKHRIKKLYSHPQAWGQCELFLSEHLKGVERQDVSSTSKAAEIVAQENPCDEHFTSGSDITQLGPDIFGLDILAYGIQDESGNMTRFFMLKKEEPEDPIESPLNAAISPTSQEEEPILTSATMPSDYASGNPFSQPTFKTLISFTIPHTSPGALAKGLGVFGDHGLNLTSINTRPSLVEPWNYLFFVEMVGKRERHGRGSVNAALRDLQGVARTWRWLGSWEMQVDTAV